MKAMRVRRLLATVALAAALGPACGTTTSVDSAHTLTVLGGSELKDLGPVFADLQSKTGYQLKFTYTGSLDGAERIVNGDHFDLAWFSSGKYLSLLQGASGKIVKQDPVMLSPVVIGVKHSVAAKFGWTSGSGVSWSDISAAAKAGNFHFAMTNPAASNSGFVALVGVAAAFAGEGTALDTKSINVDKLKEFFSGQVLTAGSSGFLADSFVRRQDQLDGIINYESVLLSLNSDNKLHERLDLIYPKDGIVTADYPLMLLNSPRRSAYDAVLAYLKQPDVQTKIMTTTGRRPVVPEVKPDSRFTTQLLVELPFPSNLNVVDALLFAYLDQIRPPAHTIFVLDISGSMDGDRINSVKRTFDNLTGADTSITGRFARLRQREEITIIPFNGHVADTWTFTINDVTAASPDLAAVRSYVNNLKANDGTAIYDALVKAYEVALAAKAAEPDKFYSIVLMTDGENNGGRNAGDFNSYFQRLNAAGKSVPTFPIIFGEANPGDLNNIATLTGGQSFDSRKVDLSQVFKVIRGYQ